MAVRLHDAPFRRLSPAEIERWSGADASSVSDCLDRACAMDGGVRPIERAMRLVGQARTVRCMVGDNSALHAALSLAEPGEVIVADAGGFLGAAVWGGLMTEAARRRGVAGLVVDGAVRDGADIIARGFACFSRGLAPAGPHKLFGGAIDCAVSCGGVAVRPGDLIVGDGDGVAVIPLERIEATATAYAALKEKESRALAALDAGGALTDFYGAPEIVRG